MLTFVVVWVLCTVAFFAVKEPATFADGLRDAAAGALVAVSIVFIPQLIK